MGQANSPADPSTLVPLSVTDPAFSYLQQLSIFQQPERNQELMARMAQILGTQQPQPDPVSRIPMANMLLPLMGGGMQMGSTAEAPPLSPEQSKMGVAQSAQFQPGDVAGALAGSALTGPGRTVLGSERGAIGRKLVEQGEKGAMEYKLWTPPVDDLQLQKLRQAIKSGEFGNTSLEEPLLRMTKQPHGSVEDLRSAMVDVLKKAKARGAPNFKVNDLFEQAGIERTPQYESRLKDPFWKSPPLSDK